MGCIVYGPHWLRTVLPFVVTEDELYTYTNVGLSALLVFDWQGNAKAFTLWNERQAGSTFLISVY